MQFQTYGEKMTALLINIANYVNNSNKGMTELSKIVKEDVNISYSGLSMKDYHDIIDRDNLIVVSSPMFPFDLSTMKTYDCDPTSNTHIVMQVQTFDISSLDKFEWKQNLLYFFYVGTEILAGTSKNIKLRFATMDMNIIEQAVGRFEAIIRLKNNLDINSDIKITRDYVKSKQFALDKNLAQIDIAAIVSEIHRARSVSGLKEE